jgi:lysozyme
MTQKKASRPVTWLAACAMLAGGYEGLRCIAYPDQLAHGLPTVCYGETEGVKLGDHYTPEQCRDMLAHKLPRYYAKISKCIHVPLSDNEKIAYTDAAYNLGPKPFCKGPIHWKLNNGDHRGACNALLQYDHASGKKVPGLTRRRHEEAKLCLTPDKPSPVVIPAPISAAHDVSLRTRVWRWIMDNL